MKYWLCLCAVALVGCSEYATFLAVEDLPVVAAPLRSRTAPNRVVGRIAAGELTTRAKVIRGTDYRYFEVRLSDGGVGYVRGGGPQMHIYEE